ncbi:S8 family serine peptidase [Actinomadura montaniterrae]|uniref:S8 family serine peptidase n=1 Tax=Actinomadura montaniterrae TaxID=1803903 RepID=A0A6L3VRZ7_9ACTN|nr:S8 family serine peptidase [Actinomadura montaniterrae]KAB2373328.1 S8 family serine peptidase [Actinomadura montaniterrae]
MSADIPRPRALRAQSVITAGMALAFLLWSCPPAQAAPSPRSEEWWFDAWQISQKVWPLTQGEGVTVALIDTGVAADLPELRGVVLPGVGYDGSSSRDGREDSDTKLGGHGTGMAALIAAQGGGSGMVGVAPKSRILPISASADDYEQTIRYAVDHHANVINLSEVMASAQCPDRVQAAVDYAVSHDVVVVAGAGNNPRWESAYAPANCSGVLTVGAVDAHLTPWEKSTPGSKVMLAAPGVSVGSIGRAGMFTLGVNGTSSATALTSGVVALMRSRFPQMSGREIVQRMLATARDVGPKGWDDKTGYGALIPYQALTADVPKTAPNPVYARISPTTVEKEAGSRPKAPGTEPAEGTQRTNSRTSRSDTVLITIAAGFALTILLGAGSVFVWRQKWKR